MTIRTARKNEIKTLQTLNKEIFIDNHKYDLDLKMDWTQSEAGKKYFTNILNNTNAICLIAEKNSVPIGYIVAAPKKFGYRLSKYIEIENIVVLPKYRSLGIGSRLITECLKIAKEKGFQKTYVSSYYKNSKAIKFYEKIGFKKIDISLEQNI